MYSHAAIVETHVGSAYNLRYWVPPAFAEARRIFLQAEVAHDEDINNGSKPDNTNCHRVGKTPAFSLQTKAEMLPKRK
jgi:hypothetical protein